MTNTVIQMRISETDKAAWQDKAREAGLSLSDWIKERCNAPVAFSMGLAECKAIHGTAIHAAAAALARTYIDDRDVMTTFDQVITYLRTQIAYAPIEHFHVLFLNRQNRLIADETLWKGTLSHAPIYPREIVTRCLELSAAAIIICHNHPSGSPEPSSADITATRDIKRACEALDITLHDHVVVGTEGHVSLRGLGKL